MTGFLQIHLEPDLSIDESETKRLRDEAKAVALSG